MPYSSCWIFTCLGWECLHPCYCWVWFSHTRELWSELCATPLQPSHIHLMCSKARFVWFFLWGTFIHFWDTIIQRKDSNVQRGEKTSLKMPGRQPLSHLPDTLLIKTLRPQVKLIVWTSRVLIAVSLLYCLLKEIDSVPGVVGIFDSVNSLIHFLKQLQDKTVDVNSRQGGQQGLDRADVYALEKVRKYLQRNAMIVGEADTQWQWDFVDIQHFSKQNDGSKNILTVIKVLSKHAWVMCLIGRMSSAILVAIRSSFSRVYRPQKL